MTISSATDQSSQTASSTAGERLRETERLLMDELRLLQESYRVAAKPVIDKIVYIRSLQPPSPIFFDVAAIMAQYDHHPVSPAVVPQDETRS